MSKKSFKQLQNRLYREIKRRMQAEQMFKIYNHNRIELVHRPIDRLVYVSSMPLNDDADERETQEIARYLMRTDIAKALAEQLVTSPYMKREIHVEPDGYGKDILYIRCSVEVCAPKRGE